MKRVKEQIKYLALLAICLLSGCSDFLDSYNPSAVTDDFYNTKEGQKKLLTDINARYRNVFNTGELQFTELISTWLFPKNLPNVCLTAMTRLSTPLLRL